MKRDTEPPRTKVGRKNGRGTSDEYDRFERTMRGLLKVPKKAIQEQGEKAKTPPG